MVILQIRACRDPRVPHSGVPPAVGPKRLRLGVASPSLVGMFSLQAALGMMVAPAARGVALASSPLGYPMSRSWRHDPAIKILNPYYIRIATAVVTNHTKGLDKYALQMQSFAADKSKPYLWFPATRARTFCLARLGDEAAFIHSFAVLCHARGVAANQAKVIKFAQALFTSLAKHNRAKWAAAAVAQGLPRAGPAPGRLYMYLLNQRLGQLPSPIAKRNLIQASIGHAIIAMQNAKRVVQPPANGPHSGPGGSRVVLGYPPKYYRYKRALETLRYMAVANDTMGLTTTDLCRNGQRYLAAYGATGRYSQIVFYQVLNQLYLVHQVLPTPAAKANILRQGNWLGTWYMKLQPQGAQKPTPLQIQVAKRWQQWQALR